MNKYIFYIFTTSFSDTGSHALEAYRNQGQWIGTNKYKLKIGRNIIEIKPGDLIIVNIRTNTFFDELKYLVK